MDRSRRGKFRWIVGSALALVASCRALEVSTVGRPRHPMTADHLRAEVAGDLPVASTRAEVAAWLDGRGLGWSELPRGADDPAPVVQSMIRDTARGGLVRTDLRLRFRFDDADRLTGFEVEPAYTGP